MRHPRPLFNLFSVFLNKCPFRMQCWVSNTQPLVHKSPLITTRQELPPVSPLCRTIFCLVKMWTNLFSSVGITVSGSTAAIHSPKPKCHDRFVFVINQKSSSQYVLLLPFIRSTLNVVASPLYPTTYLSGYSGQSFEILSIIY